MLKFYEVAVASKHVVICGRSEIVGKPMGALLLKHHATVTFCHSKTEDLKRYTGQADILVAAVGKPRFITAQHVKENAVVVDVGIHRESDGLVGDVDFDEVVNKVRAISPVPGGVGPLTISMLMRNVLLAAELQTKRK